MWHDPDDGSRRLPKQLVAHLGEVGHGEGFASPPKVAGQPDQSSAAMTASAIAIFTSG